MASPRDRPMSSHQASCSAEKPPGRLGGREWPAGYQLFLFKCITCRGRYSRMGGRQWPCVPRSISPKARSAARKCRMNLNAMTEERPAGTSSGTRWYLTGTGRCDAVWGSGNGRRSSRPWPSDGPPFQEQSDGEGDQSELERGARKNTRHELFIMTG